MSGKALADALMLTKAADRAPHTCSAAPGQTYFGAVDAVGEDIRTRTVSKDHGVNQLLHAKVAHF